MANRENSAGAQDKAARKKRATERAQKRKNRDASRKEKAAGSGKGVLLCSLASVAVKKADEGYHVMVFGSDGRKSFVLAPDEASQVLRDLETAIQVIRRQQ